MLSVLLGFSGRTIFHPRMLKLKFQEYPEMEAQFVNMLKISFKTEKDKKLVTLFTKPKEFRDYVYSNFVANGMVVTSCLNDILKLPNVTNETESLNNCNITIKML